MEATAYVLCTATAFACSILLLRRYRRGHFSLLLWCGLFFAALAVENAILFVDRVVVPETDLSIVRNTVALLGLIGLLGALIWEGK